jgi:tetratricopeptide (TPR) repeat protein
MISESRQDALLSTAWYYEEAIKVLDESRKRGGEPKDHIRKQLLIMHRLANLFYFDNPRRAANIYRRAIALGDDARVSALNEDSEFLDAKTWCLANLGWMLITLKEPAEAEAYLLKGLDNYDRLAEVDSGLRSRQCQANILSGLAEAYGELRNPVKSEEYFARGLKVTDSILDDYSDDAWTKRVAASMCVGLSRLKRNKDMEDAISLCKKGVDYYTELTQAADASADDKERLTSARTLLADLIGKDDK